MTLAEEIRLTADQVREATKRSRPAEPDEPRDWSETAHEITSRISDLMQKYEAATAPQRKPAPQGTAKEQRLKAILKLVVAEL